MKHILRDASQILIALLLTTSAASAMKLPAKPHVVQNHVSVAKAVKIAPSPQKAATAAPVAPAAPPPAPSQPAPAPPPSCETHECWMASAGIAPSDYAAVDYIVSHESGWDPNATEPNSGAHGLPQALPYSKTGCGWVDAVCQLQWANGYAVARYGGWWAAQAYWAANRNW